MTQFTTIEEAKQVVAELDAAGIGGGVIPYRREKEMEQSNPAPDEYEQASGIYVPVYIGPFATPQEGAARKFYHLRFRNGADGFNAGLVKRTMEYAPTRWPLMLATEVNAAAKPTR